MNAKGPALEGPLFPQSVIGMSMMFMLSRALYVAAQLSVADVLGKRALTAPELAEATKTHAPSLHCLLRTLTAFGVIDEREEGRFALNQVSQHLRSDVPNSCREFVLYMGADWHAQAWSDLVGTIRTGKSHFELRYGTSVFEYFTTHVEEGRYFERSMRGITRAAAPAIVACCEPGEEVRCIVDVAGGSGTLLCALLEAHPRISGVLFEMPACVEAARSYVLQSPVADRLSMISGDIFHDTLPPGDVYVLKHVLHDWDDERAIEVLQNCRRAMTPSARLWIIEAVPDSRERSPQDALMELLMLLLTGGRERTSTEYINIVERAGLRVMKIRRTGSPCSVIEVSTPGLPA